MPDLYRVAPYLPRVARGAPGHPEYLRLGAQGSGRIDNPELFVARYLSDSPACAVAEIFRYHGRWEEGTFAGPKSLPGSAYALLRFSLDAETVDLDDPDELRARALRPSGIVTPDRTVTQAWAGALYREGAWSGARWWSSLDSRWGVYGIWSQQALRLRGTPSLLGVDHPTVREAAFALDRVLG